MISIIFDSKILLGYSKSNGSRAGIYFCALELLKQFHRNLEVAVYLYVEKELLTTKFVDEFV